MRRRVPPGCGGAEAYPGQATMRLPKPRNWAILGGILLLPPRRSANRTWEGGQRLFTNPLPDIHDKIARPTRVAKPAPNDNAALRRRIADEGNCRISLRTLTTTAAQQTDACECGAQKQERSRFG